MKQRALIISSLLVLVGVIAAAPAAAKPGKDTPVKPMQLSLGDSWAFGFGAAVPSEGGYVPQLHQELQDRLNCNGNGNSQSGCKHLQLRNVAVGGATTPSMVANQYPTAIPLLEARNGNNSPRDDVEVVTLHIGGNDVTNPIVSACLIGVTPACVQTIQTEFAAYQSDLNGALGTLRAAAGAGTPIVIGTYDNPFPTCNLGQVPGASQLAALVLEGGAPFAPLGLHDIIRSVAASHGVQVAEVFGDLAPGDWVGGADCLHPNDTGYDKVTVSFLEALGLG